MYGLLGKKLKHSFSPYIHNKLGNKEYTLIEKTESEAIEFLKEKKFKGLNITIPYKELAKNLCDFLSPEAEKIGAVNTIKNIDGKLYGYNTDYFGLKKTLENLNCNIEEKKILILGNGATTKTTKVVLKDLGVENIVVASRTGEYSFNDYHYFGDSNIIINCTPVGMYPNNLESLVQINKFSNLEYVVDLIYNPIKSKLLLDSMENNVKCYNGLDMLVNQAIKSSEIFFDIDYDKKIGAKIVNEINSNEHNIVLIGMPGSGKTTVAKKLSQSTLKTLVDTDIIIEKRENKRIGDIFIEFGEEYFRELEKNIISEVGKEHNQVIATGGGSILKKENYNALKQNSIIFYIRRDIEKLELGRPVAKTLEDLRNLYNNRKALYEKYADYIIENNNIEEVVNQILDIYYKEFIGD